MKKLERLTIENFQSHEFTQIDFSPEFNVIIGESDQGKSALIRALKWLIYNEPRGVDFIRVGASRTSVTVLLTDGIQITRERTPSRNRYYLLIPGQQESIFEGFGARVPREIQDALGMGKIKLDEDLERMLNLGEQLEAPFLLAETGSVKAKAIGRLYGVHIVDAALRETVRDMGRAQQEEKRLGEELRRISADLENYSDLPGLAQKIQNITLKLEELAALTGRLDICRVLKQTKEELDAYILRVETIIKGLVKLPKYEEYLGEIGILWSRYNATREYRRELNQAREKILKAEKVLQATRDLGRAEEGEMAARECRRLGTELAHLYRENRRAEGHINRARGVLQRTEKLEQVAKCLEIYQGKGQMAAVLDGYRQEIKTIILRGKGAREAVLNAEKEIRQHGDEYGILLQKLGKCPLCFSDITPETIEGIWNEYTGEVGKWDMKSS